MRVLIWFEHTRVCVYVCIEIMIEHRAYQQAIESFRGHQRSLVHSHIGYVESHLYHPSNTIRIVSHISQSKELGDRAIERSIDVLALGSPLSLSMMSEFSYA